ncbi:FAD/NAD(P)-binding domain-containing protein [Agrocybe pediades]|nr:FAD/NAD(P)-binding domain-containing protein [Agrocybe pediades]
MTADTKKRVVVIGGGAAGATIVRNLSKTLDASKHQLILITARPKFTYLPASLRVLVSKDASLDTVFMPYDTVFGSFPGELKIGAVSSIEEMKDAPNSHVILKDGEQVAYDILVVATGSAWSGLVSFPNEEVEYKEHVESWRTKFEKASNIVIVGGGSVGIEIAGEIKDVYPTKSVTIVQGQSRLLNEIYPDRFRADIEQRLRRRGVDFLFEDQVPKDAQVDPETQTITTKNGKTLKCDLLVVARGAGPNTSLLSFLKPLPLNEQNLVDVMPTLQVRGHPSIFAAGDIINLPEAKQFAKTAGHAAVVSANVMSLLKDQEPKKECKPGKEIIVISNGKNGGAAYFGILWGLCFGDYFCRTIKSRDLLVGVVRQGLGLPKI